MLLNAQGTIRPLPCPTTVRCQPQARAEWVRTQRTASRLHPDGTPSRMPAERIRALNEIGFDWGPTKTDWNGWETSNASWKTLFEELRE